MRVKVTPRASQNRIVIGDPIKVYVSSPPVDGEANKAVVDIVAKALGVAKSRVTLVKGHSAREKTLEVEGFEPHEIAALLDAIS